MAQITLHAAQRYIDNIQRAIKGNEPKYKNSLSVFSTSVLEVIEANRATAMEAVEDILALHSIRSTIRTKLNDANAKCGLFPLIAFHNMMADQISVIQKLPGLCPPSKPLSEMETLYGRRKPVEVSPVLDSRAAAEMIAAAKQRYMSSEKDSSEEVVVGTFTAQDILGWKVRLNNLRRQQSLVGDQMHTVNAENSIDVSDTDMAWLAERGVV